MSPEEERYRRAQARVSAAEDALTIAIWAGNPSDPYEKSLERAQKKCRQCFAEYMPQARYYYSKGA
jgi:hypothetical protein